MQSLNIVTNENALALYLREIGKCKPLAQDEEISLSKRIRNGDTTALQKMVLANLRFVVSVARNYEHQGLPLEDLINEGNLGLIRAVKRFDETKNFKFISYAVWWVRQAILQALAEQSRIVNLPLNRVATIYKIGKAYKELEQRYNRLPDLQELAEELGLRIKDVREALNIGDNHASFDAPFEHDENASLLDVFLDREQERPDTEFMDISLHEEIEHTLDSLEEREKKIIKLYFGIGDEPPHTLEEIGVRFALTRERARQIKERAIRKLRSGRGWRLKAYA
ncbi:MAG: sigma-70 family RNA polymerase sigma factor [Chitinivibrionales bacterium]|nr:sigma-70 family RNA polymerase sigma factor [Chitinivibrionales bacterium]